MWSNMYIFLPVTLPFFFFFVCAITMSNCFNKSCLIHYTCFFQSNDSLVPKSWQTVDATLLEFISIQCSSLLSSVTNSCSLLFVDVPIQLLVNKLTKDRLKLLALGLSLFAFCEQIDKDDLRSYITSETSLKTCHAIFQIKSRGKRPYPEDSTPNHFDIERSPSFNILAVALHDDFPPKPCLMDEQFAIITKFIEKTSMDAVFEVGCAVCGELCLRRDSHPLERIKHKLHILEPFSSVTRATIW